ncbi:iron complex outermembrane recepter protein [Duganella sp. CF402]|uniref:TonB-dependent receptor plug domain-containing protein n=1 Tax=unclassified Duganella TaxID=2636909 RepID=UPI0008BFFC14|nr:MULTISPECIES: TonB-dependent receptor [unclassified Duganella]RZT05757.1 iron complex outermembrane receptor protein [Duganella sp. BK701]SEM92327.1 iron complex outermembrane recepter protein [Duganella sp. CF402]
MNKLLPQAGLCLVLLGAAEAGAQTDPQPVAPQQPAVKAAADKQIQQVTISGGRADDMAERRNSVAGKQIYGREELDRNGDSNLGDVLKRLPGVTLGGRPGRGGDVRMRGMGSGYTQILLNGERPPAGFSMESLSPDQVERIEIMRGPVAEHSTRAIAGTINIILRDGYQQRDNQLKLTDTVEQGRHAPNISLTVPGKTGSLTWLLTGTIAENHQHDHTDTHNVDTRSDGVETKNENVVDQTQRETRSLHLTPRLSYKFASGDTLNFQPFVMVNRSDSDARSDLTQTPGAVPASLLQPPEYNLAQTHAHSEATFLRGFGNWVHKLEGAAKLDVKFGFGSGHSDSDSLRYQYDNAGTLLDRFTDTASVRDRSASTGGKYSTPIGKEHGLAAGWDIELGHREETKTSVDKDGNAQFADSGDNLTADTRRLAVFAQDEWDISAQWSGYAGVRWEGIRTSSRRSGGGGEISNTSSVLSPLLHAVYRIPGHEKDQIRASLTKSYKAANIQDLIALPSLSRLNSATRPDRTGNPNLKPELATGLDVAYEHYLGRAGILSASGFIRDIDDLIRRDITLQDTSTGPRWVSTPRNIVHARTKGIELEAKFQLQELYADAPAIDFRTNYSRFWSSVDDIPGPNNRLDAQPKQTANLGLDYRMKDVPLTLGGSLNWTPETLIQSSLSQLVYTSRKRSFDAYALWKFNSRNQVRISASNLAAEDAIGVNTVTTNGLAQVANTINQTYTVWSVKYEMKF